LAGYLAAVTAVAVFRDPERFGRVREILDVTILVIAVGSLAWLVFIRSVLTVGLADPIRALWSALAPAMALVVTGLIARQLLRSENRREAITYALFALMGVLMAASALGDGYLRLQELGSRGGLVEMGWILAGIVLAGVGRRAGSRPPGELRRNLRFFRAATRIEALLPIAFTYAVVGTAVTDWWITREVDWLAIGASAALILLLIARQGVIVGQVEMRQFAALVNASADLSFVCDADGRLLLANPALLDAIGMPNEQAVGSRLQEHIADQNMDRVVERALLQGWSGEVELLRGNHVKVPVYLSLRPVRDERRNRPLLAGTGIDLRTIKRRETELEQALVDVASARRELEALNVALESKVAERTEELEMTIADLARLNEELKALDRLKSEFVALVSHELRSPLTNIRSGVEIVLGKADDLETNVGESLGLVHQETRRLSQLVETILDLSALEAGRFPLHPQPIHVEQIANEVLLQFPDLDHLSVNIPQELPPVIADEAGLKSVFYHLLDNASKYAPGGELQLQAEVENGSVLVSLADSGPGIPAEDRERVFEMFHRLDSRDAREIYGHGLGLPMARRLLEAMGGGIRIEPAAEQGSRFVFWLPQSKAD
jgi:PAS domain S-box-containing protein